VLVVAVLVFVAVVNPCNLEIPGKRMSRRADADKDKDKDKDPRQDMTGHNEREEEATRNAKGPRGRKKV
jgi:hypothetical protein